MVCDPYNITIPGTFFEEDLGPYIPILVISAVFEPSVYHFMVHYCKPTQNNYIFILFQGSDPRIATCRGKLQNKRSKLNQEINKELRLRAGAENLYKATTNRKLRETVALELSFVNSNLQLLKEQLAELNSSVEIYQNDRYALLFFSA